MFWTKLREDDFNTDVISVLKEMNCKVADRLKGIRVAEFAEVYLFFDYDGHHNNIPKSMGNLDALKEMLTTFNNETELGRHFICHCKNAVFTKKQLVAQRKSRNWHTKLGTIISY